jgi:hypothetical protein
MNDFIDVKLAFSNYIHNIADVVYRYVNNGGLKKVLIFPLFLIILLLEISLFPIALIGAMAKWIIYLLVSLTEDRSSMLYVFVIIFVEFFLLYYLMFVILILFYKLFDLRSNGLGRANYEYDADEFVSQHELKRGLEKNRDVEEKKEEIYVINDEDYK